MKQLTLMIFLAAFICLANIYAHSAESCPKVWDALVLELDDDEIEEVCEFYSNNIPGMLTEVEKMIPPGANDKFVQMRDLDNEENEGEKEDDHDEEDEDEELEEVFDLLMDLVEFYEEYQEVKEEDPEEAKIMLSVRKAEFRVHMLGKNIVEARKKNEDSPAAKKLETQLRDQLAKLFDQKLKMQKMELKWLEKEVQELERLIKKRERNRKRIIEHRLFEITEGDELLEF